MFNYILYRFGQFIALSLPLKLAYRVAAFISDAHYLFAWQDRKTVRENHKAIFPEKSKAEISRIRLAMFRNFAKYLVDFFRFELMDKEYLRNNVHLENMHYFEEALSKGKGVVITTAHLGNWELGGVAMALSGYSFYVVALQHKHKIVDNFFNCQRESKGIKVIPLGKAAKKCLEVLKNNGMVALVGDRDFGNNGVVCDLFGKKTRLPQGPAAFALKTGACILPGFLLRNPDDSFILRMEKPIDFTDGGLKVRNTQEAIGVYRDIFEDYIRKYPDQWYMFKKFWI